jgi:predicted alpha/beta superfamily hydrolase
MISTMQILSALAIAGALSFGFEAASAQNAAPDAVVPPGYLYLLVRLPPSDRYDHSSICMATSANGWRPDSFEYGNSALINNGRVAGFEVPWQVATRPEFEFKFTRGSWETVEVDEDGADIANRRITADQIREALLAHAEDRPARITLTISGFADERPLRWPQLAGRTSTVTGELRVIACNSAIRGDTRALRVWLPPGYDAPENAERRYPVLYMNDGQNLFDAATSFAGEWGVDEAATRLIEAGEIPPMIIVGIDNAGAARGDEYLPRSAGSRRPDMGGRADDYLRMIADEIMPLVNRNYRTLSGPEHTAFGGSSFGGVVTLHAAMSRPDLFGAILVESPSLWVEDGAFLQRVLECKQWPQRVYLAQGDREYGEGERSAELVEMTRQVADAMREAGLGEDQLLVVIGEGDAHNEAAWAKRLPAAMEFLFASPAQGSEDQPSQ